ncbi:GspH/FimT family pseudopilin [Agrilutibacter solisilvae]|uniref:Type II secretion system protein H n=1 Tax=Agrilutibacter solisilvae TaxID=2763317 RepID=A0A974Y504_9GAMM|nr:GspH/FimT family pseudopilin [Lysobacter solisilvae]QSX78301.1 GspH/FimT family pseudopilin [Lysobacter solisilvae]
MRLSRGFTLFELIAAMAVAAILLGIALPAFSHARAAASAGSVRADLAATLIDAVRHASVTGTEVIVCPSGGSLQCSGQTLWDAGWMAYADLDGDRSRDPGETLVDQVHAIDQRVHLRSTRGRTKLVFQPNGSNAGSNVTFTLCDARGTDYAVTLVMSNAGVMRTGTPTAQAAQDCMSGEG